MSVAHHPPDSCDACGYPRPVGGLTFHPARASGTERAAWLCPVCAGTPAGAAYRTAFFQEDVPMLHLLQAVSWVGNRLREDLRRGRSEVTP